MLNFIRQTAVVFFCALLIVAAFWAVSTVFIDQDPNHRAVHAWFQEHLNDPSSLKIVEWGVPELSKESPGRIGIRVKYRAKNAMGAITLQESDFAIFKGKVYMATNIE